MLPRPPRSTLFSYTTLFRSITTQLPVTRKMFPLSTSHRGFVNAGAGVYERSEEHTSELQSRRDLVCRLLLEKKKERLVRPATPFDSQARCLTRNFPSAPFFI